MQLRSKLRLFRKKIAHRRQLSGGAFQLIHPVAEMRRAGQPFGVPRDVFARHAQSGVFAVEVIQFLHMLQQHAMDFSRSPGRADGRRF